MEEIVLAAEKRANLTKGQIKDYRRKGKIPAVVYGEGKELFPLFVDQKQFQKILHTSLGENVIIHLEINEANPKTVIIKEIQRDPLNDNLLHIDFQQISLKKKIEITVPIEIIGEATGVKSGGILEQQLWELKIRCLPTKIPKSIPVDVSNLEIGKSYAVKDLSILKETEVLTNPDQVVASVVSAPVVEEVVTPAPVVAEPEVIGKGKKKEEKVEEVEEKEVKEEKTKP